jgi:hypothetical protein
MTTSNDPLALALPIKIASPAIGLCPLLGYKMA